MALPTYTTRKRRTPLEQIVSPEPVTATPSTIPTLEMAKPVMPSSPVDQILSPTAATAPVPPPVVSPPPPTAAGVTPTPVQPADPEPQPQYPDPGQDTQFGYEEEPPPVVPSTPESFNEWGAANGFRTNPIATESVMIGDGTMTPLSYATLGPSQNNVGFSYETSPQGSYNWTNDLKNLPGIKMYTPMGTLPKEQQDLWAKDNQTIVGYAQKLNEELAAIAKLRDEKKISFSEKIARFQQAYQRYTSQANQLNQKWMMQVQMYTPSAAGGTGGGVSTAPVVPEPGTENPAIQEAEDTASDILENQPLPGEGPANEAIEEAGEPPVTQTTPIEEGQFSKTAQQQLDDFLLTDPSQHEGGIAGWTQERARLQNAAKTEQGEAPPTTGGVTTPEQEAAIGEYIQQDEGLQTFLTDLLTRAGDISPEEEAGIRRKYEQATARAMSGLSARGLGRGSEAAGVLGQGEFAAEAEIGAAKREARTTGINQALEAGKQLGDITKSNQNYQLALRSQSLDELKNAQDVSFRQRAETLKNMETKAAIAIMEKEFNLKIDELAWNKWKQGAELDLSAIDLDETSRLNSTRMAMDFLSSQRGHEVTEKLGLTRAEIEKWLGGETIAVEQRALAIKQMLGLMGIQVDRERIQAGLAEAQANAEAGGDTTGAWISGGAAVIGALIANWDEIF